MGTRAAQRTVGRPLVVVAALGAALVAGGCSTSEAGADGAVDQGYVSGDGSLVQLAPDDRGDPVIQLAPPLICDQAHFDEIHSVLHDVLSRAQDVL